MAKRVHNRVIADSINGFVMQSGGDITVNGDLVAERRGPDVSASARALRALLAEHPGPRRRTVEWGLDQLAEGGDQAELGELWAELGPTLRGLADSMAAMKPHIETITSALS